ncbi:hypothetical protein [Bradyrhizobium sp. RT5a]|uniref:hypothetical protein n=1 Tax=Bradyrhizobium sp. RT5a TaxID=3156380 RepID=UPI00339315AF
MPRKSQKACVLAPADPVAAALPSPHGALELRKRPSGRWGVFRDGAYVASTGTSDARLAAIRLRMHQR